MKGKMGFFEGKFIDENGDELPESPSLLNESSRRRVNDAISRIVETFGKNCPDCPNQGWYVGIKTGRNRHTGEPEPIQVQVQCKFCYTEPKSKFNLFSQLSQLKSIITGAKNYG